MSRRSRAREIVLQVLFQDDLNDRLIDPVLGQFCRARLKGDLQLVAFARELIEGVRDHQARIDRQLELTARNWRLGRMAATDRNILRLGAYEILYTDTPDRVAINEAIELAKRYGTGQSAQFVNGILDRLMKGGEIPERAMAEPEGTDDGPPTQEEGENLDPARMDPESQPISADGLESGSAMASAETDTAAESPLPEPSEEDGATQN